VSSGITSIRAPKLPNWKPLEAFGLGPRGADVRAGLAATICLSQRRFPIRRHELMPDQKAASRATPNCAFRKPWLSLLSSNELPREKHNESSVCCLSYYSRARD
jgi:hypothetical protein